MLDQLLSVNAGLSTGLVDQPGGMRGARHIINTPANNDPAKRHLLRRLDKNLRLVALSATLKLNIPVPFFIAIFYLKSLV